jgi:leucyl-tRNA synthetase
MNTFSAETQNGLEHTLGWLNQWACSRSFGLGTRIPWDELFPCRLFLITDDVWDFVFCDGPAPKSDIPPALLCKMKQEFQYWYPFDIQVSGKDLIQNHLTFCIYNHTALQDLPRCDGMDDANFVTETANSAVMRLTKEISWIEMDIAIKETEKSYNAFMFRDALKSGFYDLQLARDYRFSCGAAGMNRDLLWQFMMSRPGSSPLFAHTTLLSTCGQRS